VGRFQCDDACRRCAARPDGRSGCCHGQWAPVPRPEACTGGSRRWLPGLGLVFLKSPSSCKNFGGRRWVRTTGISLVRRNKPRKTSSSQRRFMHLACRNHALRCPGVPGEVCTVVPASGSRSIQDHDSRARSDHLGCVRRAGTYCRSSAQIGHTFGVAPAPRRR
jgi:hypothetical protein